MRIWFYRKNSGVLYVRKNHNEWLWNWKTWRFDALTGDLKDEHKLFS